MNNENSVSQDKKPKPRIGKILLVTVLLIIIVMTLGSMFGSSDSSTSPTSADKATPAGQEELELLSFKCTSEYGFFMITGQVKNISDKPLKNVTAVGSTFTADGQFVNSSDALIDYNPILAGQTSPFSVGMTINPAMKKCKVEFKELLGGTISTKVPPSE